MFKISNYIILLILFPFYSSIYAQVQNDNLSHRFADALENYQNYEKKHRRSVRAVNTELSYLEWGNTTSTDNVIIWLHGSLSNAYEAMPFAEALSLHGYRVLAIDQYNSGKTPLPNFDASFDDLCLDIKYLMDSLNIETAVVGGFSRGGFLATNFYSLYPGYIKSLILEDGGSVAFNCSYFKLNQTELDNKLAQVNVPDDIKEQYYGFYDNKLAAYESLYDPAISSSQFEILSYIKPLNNKWITYRGMSEYYHMQDSLHMAEAIFGSPNVSNYASSIIKINPLQVFEQLEVPVLILDPVSALDPIPVTAENRILKAMHPDLIKHIIFEDVDHNVHYAKPDEFLNALMEFLSR